jgi:malate synthase
MAAAISSDELQNFAIAGANVTEAGFRQNIAVALQYIAAWLGGTGAVAINNLMEDAATAEISRAQLWQWIHHAAKLADGIAVTEELYQRVADQEQERLEKAMPTHALHFRTARKVLDEVVEKTPIAPFFTTIAYKEMP